MTKGQSAGNGPIAVEVEKDKSYYWCSCGQSKKQPFCDGSHKGTEFTPLAYKSKETKKDGKVKFHLVPEGSCDVTELTMESTVMEEKEEYTLQNPL